MGRLRTNRRFPCATALSPFLCTFVPSSGFYRGSFRLFMPGICMYFTAQAHCWEKSITPRVLPYFPLSRGVFPLQVYLHQTCHKEKDPVPALTLLLTRQTSSSCLQDKGKAFPGIASGGFGCPLLVFKSRHCHWRRQTSTALLPGSEDYPRVNPAVRQKIRVTFPKKGKKTPLGQRAGDAPTSKTRSVAKRVPKANGAGKRSLCENLTSNSRQTGRNSECSKL